MEKEKVTVATENKAAKETYERRLKVYGHWKTGRRKWCNSIYL